MGCRSPVVCAFTWERFGCASVVGAPLFGDPGTRIVLSGKTQLEGTERPRTLQWPARCTCGNSLRLATRYHTLGETLPLPGPQWGRGQPRIVHPPTYSHLHAAPSSQHPPLHTADAGASGNDRRPHCRLQTVDSTGPLTGPALCVALRGWRPHPTSPPEGCRPVGPAPSPPPPP
jgi:hypothetical protein